MPAKLQNKKGGMKKKGRRPRVATQPGRRPQGIARPRPRRGPSNSMTAPAAISTSRRMSMAYSSVNYGSRAALRVQATVPICEIGNDSKYNNGFYVQGAGTLSASYSSVCNLLPYEMSTIASTSVGVAGNPSLAAWISPHVPLLALAFDRYKVNSLDFHYEPQSTSTVSDRLVFAWTDDPAHPFLSVPGSATLTACPTQLQTLVTPDSVAFMPWKQWSLKVPVAPDIRFLYDQGAIAPGEQESSSLDRLFSFGSMSCIASAVGGDAIQYGVLYASISLDLIDPVPIVASVSTLITELHSLRRARLGRRAPIRIPPPSSFSSSPPDDSKEPSIERHEIILRREPDDDWTTPSPPAFTPAPTRDSSVPGTPNFRIATKIPSKK